MDVWRKSVSHPFGDRITQHLSRKHGLSQSKLAAGIDQDPAVISAMCNGRRLTGPHARERVRAIIGWFHDQSVLDSLAEANALLKAAGMSRLDPRDVAETELVVVLSKSTPVMPAAADAAGANTDAVPADAGPAARSDFVDPRPRRPWRNSPLFVIGLNAIGMLVIVGLLLLRQRATRLMLWEERFDPLNAEQWQAEPASATWDDLPGPGAVLRESDPALAYGKAESAPIALEADARPVLIVSVREVDPGASYSIQVLDKVRDVPLDVVKEATRSGEHVIDLVQVMGWEGPQVCTLNLWVGGEGRAVTFERIAIAGDRRTAAR